MKSWNVLRRLADLILRERQPKGYRPGLTLERVRRDLAPFDCTMPDATRLCCTAVAGAPVFEVHERVEPLFLSHTVLCEFVLSLPAGKVGEGSGRIEIRHTGVIKRQGIACVVKQGAPALLVALAERIQYDAVLQAAILPLDFRRCVLTHDDQGWRVLIEHFGASEVVNRFPAMRRYIRLTAEQRGHLLDSFTAFRRILA
ncbi:MAG: DUF3156 family protein [Pseudogulbenkiania sp.]|nr:DUF3156 family protein [Pseudogulbenkiania sp.]